MRTVCFLVLTALLVANPSVSAATYWAKQYGTSQYDGVTTVLQTADGGYIVGGAYEEAKTERDYAWVMKLAATGSVIWQKRYGTETHSLRVAAALPMPDGGYIIVGNASLLPDQEEVSAYVMKLDANGKIKWQKFCKVGSRPFLAWAARQTTDGGCIVSGMISDPARDDYSTGYLMKFQSAGTLEWFKEYDAGRACGFFMAEQTPDGGYVVGGMLAVSSKDNDADAWIVKTDPSGNISWQKRYGARLIFDMFGSVRPTSDGGYIAGGMYGYDGEDKASQWIVKLDASGNAKWQKALGGNLIDIGIVVAQTTDGGYALSGGIGLNDETTLPSVVKLDANGGVTWRRTMSSAYPGVTWTVWQTTDGGYVTGVLLASEDDLNAVILRMSSTGDIASGCGALLSTAKYNFSNTSTKAVNTTGKATSPAVTVSAGTLASYASKAATGTLCESMFEEEP